MVELGIIQRIGRGLYTLGKTKKFRPEIDDNLQRKYNSIKTEFPFVDFCIWNTSIFNEFTLHQTKRNFTIIDTEKDLQEPLFYFLKEKYKNVFLNPDKVFLLNYLYDSLNPIIIKPLVSEAPLQTIKKVQTVTLEKILVDLYSDVELFDFYQGNEKRTIYIEAFNKYTINNNRLLRYASRRGKKTEIEGFINQVVNNSSD